EDGIRDYKVTGVQTCALPIWTDSFAANKKNSDAVRTLAKEKLSAFIGWDNDNHFSMEPTADKPKVDGTAPTWVHIDVRAFNSFRSEERRVGKECRYRWSQDH